MLTDGSQDICKRRVGLGVPSCPLDWYLPIRIQCVGQQCHHRVEPEQTGRGALDGPVRPLPLRFEAQMGPTLLEGRFNGPALNELLYDRPWPIMGARREVCAW